MKETILNVLENWKNLQPNMASETCRLMLAEELHNALKNHVNQMIEDVVCGAKE